MNADELMEKYSQLTAKPLDSSTIEIESGESVAILFESSSLRILLLRKLEEPDNVSVEVEVWLPDNPKDCSLVSTSLPNASENQKLGVILAEMITHLQYLYRLYQFGFTLDIIKHDCLWTASHTFKKPPDSELFKVLLPP